MSLMESDKADLAVPVEELHPVVQAGWKPQLLALARYLTEPEVHTYAYSVAANVILSLFPFIVFLLTLSRRVFHSSAMEAVVGQLMTSLLPTGQAFVMRNAHPQKGMQVFSIVMLLISSTGVFLPLEVALNNVWGVRKGRNFLMNQVVSIGLAFAVGVLVMVSVGLTAGQQALFTWLFRGNVENIVFKVIASGVLNFFAILASIGLFFLIYWLLPNRKIPPEAVLPTAVVIGLIWEVAKYGYVLLLPKLDFRGAYGPFEISVGLMIWSFISGLLLLAGAHFSATRYAILEAQKAEAVTTLASE